MGNSYDSWGKLCCNVCGQSGGVRKHKCPFGWCPPIALCPKCKREHPEYLSRDGHRKHGCEEQHNRYEAQKAQEALLLKQGKLLRRAALCHPKHNNRVKVIFQGAGDKERAFWMAQRTYNAIPVGVPATVEDFKSKGKVTRARTTDIYDAEVSNAS